MLCIFPDCHFSNFSRPKQMCRHLFVSSPSWSLVFLGMVNCWFAWLFPASLLLKNFFLFYVQKGREDTCLLGLCHKHSCLPTLESRTSTTTINGNIPLSQNIFCVYRQCMPFKETFKWWNFAVRSVYISQAGCWRQTSIGGSAAALKKSAIAFQPILLMNRSYRTELNYSMPEAQQCAAMQSTLGRVEERKDLIRPGEVKQEPTGKIIPQSGWHFMNKPRAGAVTSERQGRKFSFPHEPSLLTLPAADVLRFWLTKNSIGPISLFVRARHTSRGQSKKTIGG